MAKGFVKNAKRVDPYKSFKFRVKWDGKTVLGISKVSALKRTTEVVKHRTVATTVPITVAGSCNLPTIHQHGARAHARS